MPLDFPSSPITGATYTAPNGTIWVWDGAKWANGVYIGTAYAPINAPTFTGDARAVTPAAGDADTSVATTAFVAAAVAPALNGVGRNVLHNGSFTVAQRGLGAWTTQGGVWTVDRWNFYTATDTFSITRPPISDAVRAVIGDEAAQNMLQNAFAGSPAAAAFQVLYQTIEGVRRLSGKTIILSFWAAASANGMKLGAVLDQAFGTGGSPSASVLGVGQSVTLTTSFARYSLTFAIPSASGKTLGTAGDDGTALSLCYSSGSTNAAHLGNPGVQSGTIWLWGVQLEIAAPGQTQPSPLEKLDPRMELANCQRFARPLIGSARGSASGAGQVTGCSLGFAPMRATPTYSVSSVGTSSNVSGGVLTIESNYSANYEIISSAAGDYFIHTTIYFLTADL